MAFDWRRITEHKATIFRYLLAACVFILISWYPWRTQTLVTGQDYFLNPDSSTYMRFSNWSQPWREYRSIGYRLFLYPFLHADVKKFMVAWEEANKAGIDVWADKAKALYSLAKETGINKKFEAIVLVQRVIEAISFTVFFLGLCRWLPALFSLLALLAVLWLAHPTQPFAIMTEPLACSLTWLCAAFLLFAPKSAFKKSCFAMSCLCASLAFLVGPRTLPLVGVCTLVFFYQALLGLRQIAWGRLAKAVLAFSPLLIAYGYIGWLSVTGGHLFLHTQWDVYYSSFMYFAEADDAEHMPTERARKYAAWYGAHREEFFNKLRNGEGRFPKLDFDRLSPVRIRGKVGDVLVYRGAVGEAWKHFKNDKSIGQLDAAGRSILGKELNAGLWARHRGDILRSWWQNFIGGLGYYSDVWVLYFFHSATFIINIVALILSMIVIIFYTNTRWPLLIMVGIHTMSILAASVGHFIIARYIIPTQPFLLLAGIYALWILCVSLYTLLIGRQKQSLGNIWVSGKKRATIQSKFCMRNKWGREWRFCRHVGAPTEPESNGSMPSQAVTKGKDFLMIVR